LRPGCASLRKPVPKLLWRTVYPSLPVALPAPPQSRPPTTDQHTIGMRLCVVQRQSAKGGRQDVAKWRKPLDSVSPIIVQAPSGATGAVNRHVALRKKTEKPDVITRSSPARLETGGFVGYGLGKNIRTRARMWQPANLTRCCRQPTDGSRHAGTDDSARPAARNSAALPRHRDKLGGEGGGVRGTCGGFFLRLNGFPPRQARWRGRGRVRGTREGFLLRLNGLPPRQARWRGDGVPAGRCFPPSLSRWRQI